MLDKNIDNVFLDKVKYLCEVLKLDKNQLAGLLGVCSKTFDDWSQVNSATINKYRLHNLFVACKKMEEKEISRNLFESILHCGMIVYNEEEYRDYLSGKSEDSGSLCLIGYLTATDTEYVEENLNDIINEVLLSYEELL